jgi:hypothetical protein
VALSVFGRFDSNPRHFSITEAVDALVFDAYIGKVLRPTIKIGDALVPDNLAAHRASRIEQVAAECVTVS